MLKKIAAAVILVAGVVVWEVNASLNKIDDALRGIGQTKEG